MEACWLSQTLGGHTEKIHPQTFDDPFFDNTGMIYIHLVPTGETVNKEYYVEVFKGVNRVSGISTRTMHQSTTPNLSQTIWTRWASRQSLSPSPDVAPRDFWLFPKLTGCRYETIEEMKEAMTKVIDTLTQEDFHGAFQKLLERYKCIAAGGDYFEGD